MLALSVGFTSGIVIRPPGTATPYLQLVRKEGAGTHQHSLPLILILLLFLHMASLWGRSTETGGYSPVRPPDGLSPASVGMLYKGHFLDDLVTASIVNLSVKGFSASMRWWRKAGFSACAVTNIINC